MARNISASTVAKTTESVVYPAFMSKFEFDSGDVNIWTGMRSVTVDSDTFTAVGGLFEIGEIQETSRLKASNLTLGLSGLDSSIVSLALTEKYSQRIGTLWFAFLDSAGAVLERLIIFKGRIDTIDFEDSGETSRAVANLEHILVALERPNERRYTSEDQKEKYPTDTGFDQVPAIQGLDIVWGRA